MDRNHDLSRRAFLAGSPPSRHHISSAVVMALPEHREGLEIHLRQIPGVEVHASDGSRIVITIEGSGSGALGETLSSISVMDGVISANMVFEHIEELEVSGS